MPSPADSNRGLELASSSPHAPPSPWQLPATVLYPARMGDTKELDRLSLNEVPVSGTDPSNYPPLPEIQSKDILSEIFMHRSVFSRPASQFEDSVNDLYPDNERLEHLGDSVVNLCATMLIRKKYPNLRVGPATKLRSLIVGNPALARHTTAYKLQDRLAVTHAQEAQLKRSVAVQGDLFEAYVGGLFTEVGLDPVLDWLNKLFMPFIEEHYMQVRRDHAMIVGGKPIDMPSPTPIQPAIVATVSTPALVSKSVSPLVRAESGHLSYLNQWLAQRGKAVDWRFDERGGNKTTPLWAVEGYVKTEDGGQELIGRAQAPTKKAAKNEVAKQAFEHFNIV